MVGIKEPPKIERVVIIPEIVKRRTISFFNQSDISLFLISLTTTKTIKSVGIEKTIEKSKVIGKTSSSPTTMPGVLFKNS